MDNKLKEAVQTLVEALSGDKSEGSYYYSWQANIAMAFKDEYDRWKRYITPTLDRAPYYSELHEIANIAAKKLLDQLCHIPEPEMTGK